MKKVKIIIGVLVVLLIGFGVLGYIEKVKQGDVAKNNDKNNGNDVVEPLPEVKNTSITPNGSNYKGIAFLTNYSIDNFNNIDYTNTTKIEGEEGVKYKYLVENNDIQFNFDIGDGVWEKYTIKNIPNIKSIKMVCGCGGCSDIYVLTEEYLYSYPLDHSVPYEEMEQEVKKIKIENIEGMGKYDSSLSNPTTCGGEDIVLKKNNGDRLIVSPDDSDKIVLNSIDVEQKKNMSLFSSNIGSISIYNTSKFVNTYTYQKDEKGQNLVITFVAEVRLPENQKVENKEFSSLFVITENNELYYINGEDENSVCKKFIDKKIKNYKIENDDKITFNYTDSTFNTYELDDYLELK